MRKIIITTVWIVVLGMCFMDLPGPTPNLEDYIFEEVQPKRPCSIDIEGWTPITPPVPVPKTPSFSI